MLITTPSSIVLLGRNLFVMKRVDFLLSPLFFLGSPNYSQLEPNSYVSALRFSQENLKGNDGELPNNSTVSIALSLILWLKYNQNVNRKWGQTRRNCSCLLCTLYSTEYSPAFGYSTPPAKAISAIPAIPANPLYAKGDHP